MYVCMYVTELALLKEHKSRRNELSREMKKSRTRYYFGKFSHINYDPGTTSHTVKYLLRKTTTTLPMEIKIAVRL